MIDYIQPDPIDVEAALGRLRADGGYEIVHESPGLEVGVYVLVAPEPDRQQPHADDELYVVLEGSGHARRSKAAPFSSTRATRRSSRPAPSTASAATSSSRCS